MVTDELEGQWVWVHPELTHDPDGKKDQIGMIAASDLAADIVFVSFEDSMPGLFSTDALFVLHTSDKISALFTEPISPELTLDLETLSKINILIQKASPADHCLAMELVRSHKAIQPFCLETLKDQLARNEQLNWNR